METLKANPNRCPFVRDSAAYAEEVRVLLYGKRHGKYRILFTIRGEWIPPTPDQRFGSTRRLGRQRDLLTVRLRQGGLCIPR